MARPFSQDTTLCTFRQRHLEALYTRYPDINLPPEDASDDRDSDRDARCSPASTVSSEGTQASLSSTSTACTTPLRMSFSEAGRKEDWFNSLGYLRLVADADLPDECLHFFYTIGSDIVNLASAILPCRSISSLRIDPKTIVALLCSLLGRIRRASVEVLHHIEQIHHLKTLAAFHTKPRDQDVWSAYLQRAKLVIQHTALPSKVEYGLIKSVSDLFQSQIYEPFLRGDCMAGKIRSAGMEEAVNHLYDAVMTLQHGYGRWCREMKDFRSVHMLPLLAQIHSCRALLQPIQSFQRSKQIAEEAIRRPQAPGTLPADERVIKALNLSARRKSDKFRRTKTRYKREHTI